MNQCTPRNTRVAATVAATPHATAAAMVLVRFERPRVAINATAASVAAAAVECPDGNDVPAKPGEPAEVGAGGSTTYLMPFDSANCPPTTSVMNKKIARVGRRTYSTMLATTAIKMTPRVPPISLSMRSTFGRPLGGVLGAIAGEATVDRLQSEVGADHRQQDADAHGSGSNHANSDRERETGLGLRIEVATEVVGEPGVPLDLVDDLLSRHCWGLDRRPALGEQRHEPADDSTGTEHERNDHVVVYPSSHAGRPRSVFHPGREQVRQAQRGPRLCGGVALIAVLTLLGLLLTSGILAGMRRWDASISDDLASGRDGQAVDLALFITRLGDTASILVLLALITAAAALTRRWRVALFVPLAMLIEITTFLSVNSLVGRARPDVVKIGPIPHTFSYPSGHVAAIWVCWIGATLLATAYAPRWIARTLGAVGALLTALMAWARVYLGMHYTLDVVVGLLMGIGALAVSWFALTIDPSRQRNADGDDDVTEFGARAASRHPAAFSRGSLWSTGVRRRHLDAEQLSRPRLLASGLRASPLRGDDVQRAAVSAAEHAGEASSVDVDRLHHRAAFAHAHTSAVGHVGVPDRAVDIDADAVGRAIAQVGPQPPVRQVAAVVDVERRQPLAVRLGHDQGGVVRTDRHPVREQQIVGDESGRAIRVHHGDDARPHRFARHHVEADAVDVDVVATVDHDLVPWSIHDRSELGVQRQRSVRLQSHEATIAAGDDQQLAVRRPVEAERERPHGRDHLDRAGGIDGQQLLRAPVSQPQASVAPPR